MCLGGGVAANSLLRERFLDACAGTAGTPSCRAGRCAPTTPPWCRAGDGRLLLPTGRPARRRRRPEPALPCRSLPDLDDRRITIKAGIDRWPHPRPRRPHRRGPARLPDDPSPSSRGGGAHDSGLDDLTDALLGHFVDQARRSGATWTQIGDALGVTKQAAQQRIVHGVHRPAHPRPRCPRSWSTAASAFTPGRSVVVAAQEAAVGFGDTEIGSQHLLVGLYAEPDGVAACARRARRRPGDGAAALGLSEGDPSRCGATCPSVRGEAGTGACPAGRPGPRAQLHRHRAHPPASPARAGSLGAHPRGAASSTVP